MQQAVPNIEELFFAARELKSPEARSAFLDEVCSDREVRRRVEQLLAVDPEANDFLAAPAPMPTATAPLDSRSDAEGPGTVIGPYKLLEAIGEGGMGTVYMAEQAEPVRRRVALKLIKPGMDSRQVVARFEAERQALALMDHPNIARVLDGGMTPAGRPYFVMELVRGLPITEYCDRHQLSIPERLELFVLVCRAVQHAHQKGVIHRDLKPSNVLVTVIDGAAVPKVIDFGVAKATGQSLTDKTLFTGFHQFLGTPLYVSPEQAELSGVDVDTRSDIYSLGVLLYELLTGTTPFDPETFRRAAFDELRRIIREEEPPKPSTRLSTLGERLSTVSARRKADPRRLGASMKSELDWVVMKALEKDRRRRYETANDFTADVLRYLTDQPVEACPPSAWYRFTKFARRNRVALTTAGAITAVAVAAIVIGAAAVWREKEQTRLALLQSQAHARTADERLGLARRAVDEMYTEVAEKWLTQGGQATPLARQFLEKALAFYEGFAAEKGEDAKVRFEAAKASLRVGKICRALGKYAEAEAALRHAVEQFVPVTREYPDDSEFRGGLAQAYMELAYVIRQRGREGDSEQAIRRSLEGYLEAEEALRRALPIQEALVAELPNEPARRLSLSSTLNDLSAVRAELGRGPESEELLHRSIAILEELVKDYPEIPLYRNNLARGEFNLGLRFQKRGELPEAIRHVERAVELEKASIKVSPQNHAYRLLLFSDSQAGILVELVDHAMHDPGLSPEQRAALIRGHVERFKTVIQEVARLGADDFPTQYAVADLLTTAPAAEMRDPTLALQMARRAVELRPESKGALQSLAWALYRAGDWKGCLETFRQKGNFHEDDHFAAMAYWQLGDKAQARTTFERADKELVRYVKRWKEKKQLGIEDHPSPDILRRIRDEAKALIGLPSQPDDVTATPEAPEP